MKSIGIDIGSTTVKVLVLGEDRSVLYSDYRRHCAHTQETLSDLLKEAQSVVKDEPVTAGITGSGSINLGKALGIPFVQEVVAVATALKDKAPQTDVAIELGGEDAKIIYFKGGLDERMNGICAGGTGSFIDQMAALVKTDAAGLNEEAKNYQQIYPIAARCGVFAKTDIQPLINEGATKPDLAASIFQSVVNQTISGLAQGKPIRGHVAFLGGPLHFLTELKKAFIRTLHLTPEEVIDPADSHMFAAYGAALEVSGAECETGACRTSFIVGELLDRLEKGIDLSFELKRLEPLFTDEDDLNAFLDRHAKAVVKKQELSSYCGNAFLGIDAGSTTTKLALIGENGELLWSSYANNEGNPIRTAMNAIEALSEDLPEEVRIVRSCSTGYGESLLKSAFRLEEGEVETIAHSRAAEFFDPAVDCVLDIGGQDMKCIKLKNNSVENVMLNEACSSGCGSFIENFANSLGYNAKEFAEKAVFAKNPVDLGTRCTVFMNSNVKQAQKEGAPVSDISAGLAYSVIKNALYKVIKLTDASQLGSHIVVQGGTFYNKAVLRAFEKLVGAEVICPDISGIMGAFGAALIALDRYNALSCSGDNTPTMLPLEEIPNLTYETKTTRCGGCSNNCMLTVNIFEGGRRHITGNRCEKPLGGGDRVKKGRNLFAFKRERIFAYTPLEESEAKRGTLGLVRALNMYENYPFWATFFKELGFRTVLSPLSDRKLYELGMDSIPSESECYPAKLAHGHVQWLINQGITDIFEPCVFYEHKEVEGAQKNYNCPIVVSYAENIKNNVEDVTSGKARILRPFLAFTSEQICADRMVQFCKDEWNIGEAEVRRAVALAWKEQRLAKEDIRKEGADVLREMEENGEKGIVVVGRPYHIDPEINHGIPEMIAGYGLHVLTEDSLPIDFEPQRPLRVNDQWVYHSRLYSAAEFVRGRNDLEILQLNSFGCGLDAVTSDQVREIMEQSGRLYTLLKIDEVNNLGAARIRIRSLLAAMRLREERHILPKAGPVGYDRTVYTKQMQDEKWTIIAPQMSPIHFDVLEPMFRKHGYNFVILDNDNRTAIDTGLKFVNNDACFPSITVVGQIMEAVLSGRYDTDHMAIMMTQTGGCCRASNYIAFIRRALENCNLAHIPVISLNANGMETNPGFKLTAAMLKDGLMAVVYGDLFERCVYRTRPYEKVPGSANALHEKLKKIVLDALMKGESVFSYRKHCRMIVEAFDSLPLDETVKKPRVGVVGEILVKYMPLANNHVVELLEREGAEAVVPDLMDFLNYSTYDNVYLAKYLGIKKSSAVKAMLVIKAIRLLRKPANDALKRSKRFESMMPIEKVAELAAPFLSMGNQYGEGWFLCGEMAELIEEGVPNIVCIQPFGCLPNHVVGKGVIKALKNHYPQANIAAVDYDPGASEVNQLNRIKLMLSAARANMKQNNEKK